MSKFQQFLRNSALLLITCFALLLFMGGHHMYAFVALLVVIGELST